MRKYTALLLATFLLLAAVPAAAGTVITVSGSGDTLVSADTAVISLGVSARDRDVLQAQAKVNGTIAAIRQALADLGIQEDQISTDYMNIYAMYDYTNDREELSAYNASSTLAIRVTDPGSAGLLIDAAFAAGANTLNGISFSASDTEEAKAESLKKAAADARVRAEILAEAAGLKITKILTITEGEVYHSSSSAENLAVRAKGDTEEAVETGTVVQAAKLVVHAAVSISFEAE